MKQKLFIFNKVKQKIQILNQKCRIYTLTIDNKIKKNNKRKIKK